MTASTPRSGQGGTDTPERKSAAGRVILALIGTLALAGTMLATGLPAAAASPRACRVANPDTGRSTGSLQRAVRAASKGDRLVVRGTCRGVTWIGKDLSIRGVQTATSGRPVLDGAGEGTVLKIGARATVTLRDLTVRRGAASRGGGIYNRGTLVLRDVVVRANTATELGGGIWNHAGAILKLRGTSVVRGNTSASGGGGIADLGTLWLVGSSSVRGNSADEYGGGVHVSYQATMVMNGSTSITGNSAVGVDVFTPRGGGVDTNGIVTMRDSSVISGNSSARLGGGVHIDPMGSLVLRDMSSIHDNEAADGGGVFAFGGSLDGLRMPPDPDSNVHDNIPDDCHAMEEYYGEADAGSAGDIACDALASDPDTSASQPVGVPTSSEPTSLGTPTKYE
jgi:hypothetical protein